MERKNVRKLALFLILTAGVLFFGVSREAQAATVCKFGDVNSDGKIDSTDLLWVLRHIAVSAGQSSYEEHPDWLLEGVKYKAADVNQDGQVDEKDSELIQYHCAAVKNPTIGKLILTVSLTDGRTGETHDCFPVIYDVKYPSGCWYPELKRLSEEGRSFDGWYTSPSGGRKVSSYSQVTTKDDHTLYARWTVNKYYLFYDANGGDCSVSGKEVAYQSNYGTLPTPKRTGYAFAGWYTARDGGEKVTAERRMGAADTTLYAHWTIDRYLLTYIANGGKCAVADAWFGYGEDYGELPTPEREGYTFDGWYTDPENGAQVTAQTKMGSSPTTIYAHWKANAYSVTFDANGGGNVANKKVIFGGVYGTLPVPQKQKYVFLGWYTLKNGGVQVTSTTKVTETKAHTLYAHWKNETEISLSKTNVTVYIGKTYQLRAAVTGKGGRKVWSSSNPKVASVNAGGKVTAKKAGVAKITVTVNGIRKVCTVTVKKISLKLNKTSLIMGINQTAQLTASVNGPSQKITWSTSDKTVAQISSNGKITALKRGKATVRAKANGVTATVKVTVNYLDVKDFMTKGAGNQETVIEMKKLVKAVGKMKAGNKKKYPDAYYAGNKMVIGVNNHPTYGADYDEYVRIENNGNKQALFYGVKIGYTRRQMETKFKSYNIVSYDSGKSYSNANGWAVWPVFKNGKLTKYVYLSKPTSGSDSDTGDAKTVPYMELREKCFVYKNNEFMYGIAFGATGKAYIGVWDPSGTGSSYEDFLFEVKEGVYNYVLKGRRSSYIYDIHLVLHSSSVEVRISCQDASYAYFDVDQTFHYTKNASFVELAK